MKLHLNPKVTISSLPPTIDAVRHADDLIYYNVPHIYIANIMTNKILHKFRYEDVQLLRVHEDLLYICTSDIYILDLCSYEILDVIKLSKALINKVAFSGNDILVSKISNRVAYISDRRKLFEFSVTNFCEGLFVNQFFHGYYDLERVVVFSNNKTKICEMEISEAIGTMPFSDKVFVLNASGSLVELVSGASIDLGIELDLCYMSPNSIFAAGNGIIYEIGYSGAVIGQQVLSEMLEEYSGSVGDTYNKMKQVIQERTDLHQSLSRVKKIKIDEPSDTSDLSHNELLGDKLNGDMPSDEVSEDECTDGSLSGDQEHSGHDHLSQESSIDGSSSANGILEIVYFAENFVKTSENDLIFIKNGKICKIISFVDDVTDSMRYSNSLILSTSSGFMKYTDLSLYSEGEYVFDSRIVRISSDSITSAKLSNDIVIAGSRDKKCQVFKLVSTNGHLVFDKVYEFSNFRAAITSLAFERSILAVASSDNILQIYKGEQDMASSSAEDYVLYFHTFENISTQHMHSKSITHVAITPKFIITSSSDKSSKVLDHNGILIKTLQSDKLLNSSYDAKYIAISSHKAIKIYHNPSLAQLSVFQTKRPVLSSCFYNGYLLGVTDVLRVYDLDKKRCVKSYDLGLVNCWSFSYPFLCAENKIVILEDRSKEVHEELLGSIRELRENTVLIDAFLRENKFNEAISVLLKKGDSRRMHQVVVRGFYFDRSLSFLEDFMKNGELKVKIFECLLKNSGFKNSEVFNTIAQRFFQAKFDRSKKEKVLQVVKKHASAMDEAFIDFLSLDIFNKQF